MLVLAAVCASHSNSEVLRDGTIGNAGPGSVATTPGPSGGTDYLIGESDDLLVGGRNLFHSFERFDLLSGERAIHQGSASIENLITRVTGGASSIEGTLRSEISDANTPVLEIDFGAEIAARPIGAGALGDAGSLEFQIDDQLFVMLAHDGKLSFDRFSDALARSKFRDESLELLILSACETAEGDEQAALGLSGLAVKAGARSALGSIWQVNDEATAEFMLNFYESLKQPGRSRAQAMRAAQLSLLEQRIYRHPYYWAPFLMINSWL